MANAEHPVYLTAIGAVTTTFFCLGDEAMKYTAFWLTLAAACAFSVGSALAQGAGQGQHEVGSGVGNSSTPAGTGSGDHVGQAKNGPNGSLGAGVPSGVHNDSAGQGKHEAGGSGGGNNEVSPRSPITTEPRPVVAPDSRAAQPQPDLTTSKEIRNDNNKPMSRNQIQGEGRMNNGNENDWRFVFNGGMWWYYQPDNSWSYYQNGSWQNYNENEPRTASRMDRDMNRDNVNHDRNANQTNQSNRHETDVNKSNPNNSNHESGSNEKNVEKH